MPRKRQRFSRLKYALKNTEGTPTGTGEVAEYFKFITGQNKQTQENKIPVEARQLYNVAVIPFGVSATDTTVDERYICLMSAYSLKGLDERAEITRTELGIYTIEGNEKINPNFYPALIRATYDASGVSEVPNQQSAITKKTYNYKYKRTFSFPFGRTTSATDAEEGTAEASIANVDETDVLQYAQTKLKTGTGTKVVESLGYEPEMFESPSTALDFTAAVAGATNGVGTFDVG